MLTIIHGSDTAASRNYFHSEKARSPEGVQVDAEQVNLTDLAQVLEGGGLFTETKHIFIEQFLTKRKKSSDYKIIIEYLETHAKDHSIYLWEGKELDISTLKIFKQPIIKAFKLPQTLFLFLDAIKPDNGKQLVKLFHETIQSTEPEMVFFMLVRQFRLMLALHPEQSPSQEQPIDEIKRLSWQKAKLEKQAAAFSLAELLNLYSHLYSIEQGQKTGTLTAPLASAIDFLLVDI